LFDLKRIEFQKEGRDYKKEYLYFDVVSDSEIGLSRLDELASESEHRLKSPSSNKPIIFIYVEECDMSCLDQDRFDNAVIKINKNAKKANMKLIYSTSRVSDDTVSKKLLDSFDLILYGPLIEYTYDYLGVIKPDNLKQFDFVVTTQAERRI
jgi:hypothetical protein